MTQTTLRVNEHGLVQHADLQHLITALHDKGYQVIGPTRQDSAVVYDEIDSIADLPAGWTDEQDGGTYRLKRRDDAALFGYTNSPQSWKKFLHPPRRRLWQAQREDAESDFVFIPENGILPRYAFLGVRACELNAIAIQNTVFTKGPFIDPMFKSLHDAAFIVAVNCTQAGGTCFCASMDSGPHAQSGFDLALTELIDADRHVFLVEVGSRRGAEVMEQVPFEPAQEHDLAAVRRIAADVADNMGRVMNTTDIKQFLYDNVNHPRWDDVANRCLTCSNCTIVCPTCFCSTVEDVTDLTGNQAERWQRWDSCFTLDFAYIHGGSVRALARNRYRQWMTHKLAAWIDQFDSSGCVGCGRCITWCPVGIDITEEVHAMHEADTTSAEISTLNMV
jgi:ferredoxin